MAEMDDISSVARSPILTGVLKFTIIEGDISQDFYIARTLLSQKAPEILHDKILPIVLTPTNVIIESATIEIATFELFVKWLESDSQRSRHHPTLSPLYVAYNKKSWAGLMPIVKTYIFGELYNTTQLCEDAMHQLSMYMIAHIKHLGRKRFLRRMLSKHGMDAEVIEYVYAQVEINSPLRRFFVDSYCAAYVEESNQSYALLRYPKEFLVDVMIQRTEIAGEDGVVSGIKEAMRRVEEWQVDGEETGKTKMVRN